MFTFDVTRSEFIKIRCILLRLNLIEMHLIRGRPFGTSDTLRYFVPSDLIGPKPEISKLDPKRGTFFCSGKMNFGKFRFSGSKSFSPSESAPAPKARQPLAATPRVKEPEKQVRFAKQHYEATVPVKNLTPPTPVPADTSVESHSPYEELKRSAQKLMMEQLTEAKALGLAVSMIPPDEMLTLH